MKGLSTNPNQLSTVHSTAQRALSSLTVTKVRDLLSKVHSYSVRTDGWFFQCSEGEKKTTKEEMKERQISYEVYTQNNNYGAFTDITVIFSKPVRFQFSQ